jgi:hypothetical protein
MPTSVGDAIKIKTIAPMLERLEVIHAPIRSASMAIGRRLRRRLSSNFHADSQEIGFATRRCD